MYNTEFLITALSDVADEADNRKLYLEAQELTELIVMISKFAELDKIGYIKQVTIDGKKKYEVKSEKNPDWSGGIYDTRAAAKKRLAEVEMFKHMKGKKSSK
jgi:hypothetical protein